MRNHAIKREEKIINLIAELIMVGQEIPTNNIINKLEGIKIGKNLGGMSVLLWEQEI